MTTDEAPPKATDVDAENRERRAAPRVFVDLEVDYHCEDTFLFAYITDVSALGIFVRTNNPEAPGTRLNLRFKLPGADEALQVDGEVIWINPFRPGDIDNLNPGMGIRFLDLEGAAKSQLVGLVRKIAYLDDSNAEAAPEDAAKAAAELEAQRAEDES